MKKILKTIGWFLIIALIAIQFFHPKKNISEGDQPYAFAKVHAVPENVNVILKKACNDCHSNNTEYPWYTKVQPVHWWLNNHINEGKKEINFDDYANRSLRFQYRKLEEIIKQVKEGEMPLDSYTWVHKNAILTQEEKNTMIAWAEGLMKNMEAKYPIDSLKRKGPPPPQK